MHKPPCRWGILGTANIARKNWQAILDAGNARVVAVASRELSKSERFIADCQSAVPHPFPPAALGSYEEMIVHPHVDAVYIPLPTGIRKEWVLRAVQAGKHVLVEKPVGCTTDDVAQILSACEQKQVQFMDGVMFMHAGRLEKMRAILDEGLHVGRIRRIHSQFSFHGGEDFLRTNIRTDPALEPHGCLGDLGWYCIRFALWAMNWEMPARVTGRILAQTGRPHASAIVPTEFSGELLFNGGVSASFFCSFIAEHQQWAVISGGRGLLRVDDFVLPFQGDRTRFSVTNSDFQMTNCRFNMIEGHLDFELTEPANNAPGSPEANLFRRFSDLVLSGKMDPFWPRISLQTQTVMDACLQSARNGSGEIAIA